MRRCTLGLIVIMATSFAVFRIAAAGLIDEIAPLGARSASNSVETDPSNSSKVRGFLLQDTLDRQTFKRLKKRDESLPIDQVIVSPLYDAEYFDGDNTRSLSDQAGPDEEYLLELLDRVYLSMEADLLLESEQVVAPLEKPDVVPTSSSGLPASRDGDLIPEPTSLTLLSIAGLGLAAGRIRQRCKRRTAV